MPVRKKIWGVGERSLALNEYQLESEALLDAMTVVWPRAKFDRIALASMPYVPQFGGIIERSMKCPYRVESCIHVV